MCVVRLDVIVTSTVLVDQHPVQHHLALRLKMTIDLLVVTCVDSQGAIAISIALVGQHLAQHHLVLSSIRATDPEVVTFVGHLAVIAETTQTNVLISH